MIATNVGGNPEIINEKNGYLIKKNNHVQLFKKMKIIMENPKKFRQLSIQAKLDSQKYSFKKTISEYTSIYKNLMGNGA